MILKKTYPESILVPKKFMYTITAKRTNSRTFSEPKKYVMLRGDVKSGNMLSEKEFFVHKRGQRA